MAAVGLAQNFAALRALAVEGIQKGHMNLHARNIALSAGVPSGLVEDAVNFMKVNGKINSDSAKEYLSAYQLYSWIRESNTERDKQHKIHRPLSNFFVELPVSSLKDDKIRFNLVFDC